MADMKRAFPVRVALKMLGIFVILLDSFVKDPPQPRVAGLGVFRDSAIRHFQKGR
jgi:hypothetical protein